MLRKIDQNGDCVVQKVAHKSGVTLGYQAGYPGVAMVRFNRLSDALHYAGIDVINKVRKEPPVIHC